MVRRSSARPILRAVRRPQEASASAQGSVEQDGYLILAGVFGQPETQRLIDVVSTVVSQSGVRSRGGVYAVRNLLHLSPAIRELASSATVRSIVQGNLAKEAFPVRATLFDKTAGANWLVPWHQDLTICVASRIDVAGYGPWTVKAGVCHVQPPARILENMLSVRIHLDDCDQDNGALRVLPGTHVFGRLSSEQIAELQRAAASVFCAAMAGDVLLMKPLLVHASSAASRATHRRVVHIDYACSQLAGGLRWQTAGSY